MENRLSRHRVDVDEYYDMAREGRLAWDARVELIDGEIIDMPPIGSFHASVVNSLARLFNLAVGERALVSVQAPVHLDRFSEPQPDLALLAMREDRYKMSHPSAADIVLVVEVSHSSLSRDRDIKLPLYARHGVPEVWIVDLEAGQLHSFKTPTEGHYAEGFCVSKPGTISPALLPAVAVDLSGLLRF